VRNGSCGGIAPCSGRFRAGIRHFMTAGGLQCRCLANVFTEIATGVTICAGIAF
jgi:hypothetical protein